MPYTLYYQVVGASSFTIGPSVTGNGSFALITGMPVNAQIVAYSAGYDGTSYGLPGFATLSLASPSTLSGAIQSMFSTTPTLVSLFTGGLWTGEVPEGASPPYAWLDLPDTATMPNFVDQFESSRVVVNIFAVGAAAAENCAMQFKAAFDYDNADLTFSAASGATTIMLMPIGYKLTCEMMRAKNGQLIYRATLIYRILVQRPR